MSYRGAGITHNKLLLRRYGIVRSAAKEGGERGGGGVLRDAIGGWMTSTRWLREPAWLQRLRNAPARQGFDLANKYDTGMHDRQRYRVFCSLFGNFHATTLIEIIIIVIIIIIITICARQEAKCQKHRPPFATGIPSLPAPYPPLGLALTNWAV